LSVTVPNEPTLVVAVPKLIFSTVAVPPVRSSAAFCALLALAARMMPLPVSVDVKLPLLTSSRYHRPVVPFATVVVPLTVRLPPSTRPVALELLPLRLRFPVRSAVPPVTTKPALLEAGVVAESPSPPPVLANEAEVAVNAPPLTLRRPPLLEVLSKVMPPLKFAAPDLNSNRPITPVPLPPYRELLATLTVGPSTTTSPFPVETSRVFSVLVADPPMVSVPAETSARFGADDADPALTAPFKMTLPQTLIVRCFVPVPPWIVPLMVSEFVLLLLTKRSVLSAVLARMLASTTWLLATVLLNVMASVPLGVSSVSVWAPAPPAPIV